MPKCFPPPANPTQLVLLFISLMCLAHVWSHGVWTAQGSCRQMPNHAGLSRASSCLVLPTAQPTPHPPGPAASTRGWSPPIAGKPVLPQEPWRPHLLQSWAGQAALQDQVREFSPAPCLCLPLLPPESWRVVAIIHCGWSCALPSAPSRSRLSLPCPAALQKCCGAALAAQHSALPGKTSCSGGKGLVLARLTPQPVHTNSPTNSHTNMGMRRQHGSELDGEQHQ